MMVRGDHLYSMTGYVLVSCRLTPQENLGTSFALSQYILYDGLARLHAIRYVHLQQLCKVHTIGKSSLSHERSTRFLPALLICSYWSTTCKITCQPYPQDNAHSTPTVLVTFQFKTSGRWLCVVPWRASCAARLEKECVCVCVHSHVQPHPFKTQAVQD